MIYKKILFIGDLRTAYNYGAIATTESLLDLIKQTVPLADVKLIDSRSFSGNTPVDGWPKIDYKEILQVQRSARTKVVKTLKKYKIVKSIKKVKRYFERKKYKSDNIPARYDAYSVTADKVLNGNQWNFEKQLINWADIVIINGEGNIVNGTDEQGLYRNGGRYILFLAYLAKMVFQKPCYIVNHTVDPKNRDIKTIIQNIYPQMDGVFVREKMSFALLKEWNVFNVKYVPDALWTHDFENENEVKKPLVLQNFDFSKPYICLGDSSGIYSNYSHVKWNVIEVYTNMIKQLKDVCPQIIFIDGYNEGNDDINIVIRNNMLHSVSLNNCSYHELYYVLKHAELFISGRWHASIIALLAHTPILLWGSDSHKTEALYGEIGYSHEFFDVASLPLNIDRLVAEAKVVMAENMAYVWDRVEDIKKQATNNIEMFLEHKGTED